MTIDKAQLKKLLNRRNPAKAIGEFIIDETTRSDLSFLTPFCTQDSHPDSAAFLIDRMDLRGDHNLEIYLTAYFSEEYQSKVGKAFRKLHKEILRVIVDLDAGLVDLVALPEKPSPTAP